MWLITDLYHIDLLLLTGEVKQSWFVLSWLHSMETRVSSTFQNAVICHKLHSTVQITVQTDRMFRYFNKSNKVLDFKTHFINISVAYLITVKHQWWQSSMLVHVAVLIRETTIGICKNNIDYWWSSSAVWKEWRSYLRKSFLEIASKKFRLIALDLSVLHRFVIQECVKLHCLVCSCSILIL